PLRHLWGMAPHALALAPLGIRPRTPAHKGDRMTNLNELAERIYGANKAKGFWDRERPLTETTMLIVTELGEAVEEERAGNAGLYYLDTETNEVVLADDAYGHWDGLVRSKARASGPLKPEGVDVELIDAL